MRTWMSKIYDTATRNKMIEAMHKTTRIGCEEVIHQAIRSCAIPSVVNYIEKYCLDTTRQWALHARQHSPLLLQVTTTNPLESYHSELKRQTSRTHGFIGMHLETEHHVYLLQQQGVNRSPCLSLPCDALL
jgi:hypothetical protein